MPAPCLPWASDPPGVCGWEEGRHWARGLGGGPSEPGWEALGCLEPGLLLTVCCYYSLWTWTWISLLLSSTPCFTGKVNLLSSPPSWSMTWERLVFTVAHAVLVPFLPCDLGDSRVLCGQWAWTPTSAQLSWWVASRGMASALPLGLPQTSSILPPALSLGASCSPPCDVPGASRSPPCDVMSAFTPPASSCAQNPSGSCSSLVPGKQSKTETNWSVSNQWV